MTKKINYTDFKKLFIKFVDELCQYDFEIIKKQVQLDNASIKNANYSFRVAAWERIEKDNKEIWRDEFIKLIRRFVYLLSEEDFQLLHEGVKDDTWGFLRVSTWICIATHNRISREKELNLPEMRNALIQLEMIGQKLDQICTKIPTFLQLDEIDRANLLGLLKLSTQNVVSAEDRLLSRLEIIEKRGWGTNA